ncbi:ECF transporter S component [Sinanaerobacter sp. ZZT-01]|uniref:ECF transporter S component n=1 Tax=Sinanaerobacter sp. ZZT-01 TaxID=3111540 RepID=UPI002D79B580|nr:ECF transporter S component [Sinanaerobacter sp. ZZT-01]WRR94686.1 ECF transporter S component [Sinanaerobacter sp. ZZT-01]
MAVDNKINKMILTGLMMALITVATLIVQIPIPFTNGYIHLGDSMIFLSVLILGWRYGALAAAFGSALGDLIPGYIHWVPWTFCIKGLMAIFMGIAIEKCMNSRKNTAILAIITAFVWMGFQVAVQWILKGTAVNEPHSLLGDEVENLSELGTFLTGVQGKLMFTTVLIPVFLIIIAIYVRKKEHLVIPVYEILAMTISGLWMVMGYYAAAGIMYGNFAVSAFSIPWNVVQFALGFFLAMVIAAALLRTSASKYFTYGLVRKNKSERN